jgi:hypothetical protein
MGFNVNEQMPFQTAAFPMQSAPSGVPLSRTVAEHLTCSLMLLEFVPMRSGSQQCLNVASWSRFHGDDTCSNPIGAPRFSDSVHVLVHISVRHYCHLLRHPAKSIWRAGLLFCERYANPCIDVHLAAIFQELDSKSVGGNSMGVQLPLPAPI